MEAKKRQEAFKLIMAGCKMLGWTVCIDDAIDENAQTAGMVIGTHDFLGAFDVDFTEVTDK